MYSIAPAEAALAGKNVLYKESTYTWYMLTSVSILLQLRTRRSLRARERGIHLGRALLSRILSSEAREVRVLVLK
jgi:hypothetical protein